MSEALGEGALAAVDDLARARGDMEIVFRGLREGETIEAFAARRLAGRSAAPATIDPRPFREHGVEQVPAILDRETDRLVRGVADPDALDSRADGETLGPVVAISEVDLAEVMKARAVAIDWQARMRAAVGRYFQRTRFESVKPAVVTRVRRIDARVRLASDFVLPDGRVVARAGDLFDPSERQPLTLTLIVFNPRDDAEADLVAALLPDVDKPVLIATEVEALQGWESLGRLRERYGEPVHLLTPDLRRRFAIERTVSVVTGGEGWFEVREIAADARDAERAP
jgi:conjugal transfer pilus assembly protein TraW